MSFVDQAAARVHVWPRVLVACAILTSALAATWSTLENSPDLVVAFIFWAPVAIVAMPLLTLVGGTFSRLCVVGAGLLVALAVVGCYFGLFIHLPAVFILFAAALADPNGDRSYQVAIAVGLTLSLGATVGWAIVLR